MKIISLTIPHNEQRYDTAGDWWFDESGDLQIRVSKLSNPYREFLVSIHEQAEAMMCLARGISEKDVSDFDIRFEQDRAKGLVSATREPGDAPDAPYRKEHFSATNIERIMASELDVDWDQYDAEVSIL